jgi:hypothetical protein
MHLNPQPIKYERVKWKKKTHKKPVFVYPS